MQKQNYPSLNKYKAILILQFRKNLDNHESRK